MLIMSFDIVSIKMRREKLMTMKMTNNADDDDSDDDLSLIHTPSPRD